jgi:hypothetical protein
MGSGRRLLPAVTVAAAVGIAAVVPLFLAFGPTNPFGSGDHAVRRPLPSHTAVTLGGEGTVELDLGLPTLESLRSCLSPGFATTRIDVTVLYAMQQQTRDGEAPALLLRNRAGDVRMCDIDGIDSPGEAPVPLPDAGQPVTFVGTGRSTWTCDDELTSRFLATQWLAVASEVADVRVRYHVDGTPGPWFVTKRAGGYVHLQAWIDGPDPADTRYAVEYRVLDTDGNAVPQDVLPTRPTSITGCPAGSTTMIG